MKHVSPLSILMSAMLASSLLLTGCTTSKSGDVYSRNSARSIQTVETGVVKSVRQVKLEGTNSGVGTFGGAVVGGIAGSHVGGGDGRIVGGVVGSILGGIVGNSIEKNTTQSNGLEITILLDNGRTIAVVQEGNDDIRPGDRVNVLSGNGESRVTRN
ncbi:glycine zipper 2TM domain-containing protein [Leeia sp. TBRC 13508]|uniref:Glycine zipper 2TM domain-containing protein n=1 Tax=Leeia speluncae TaxID=2884804 RepID=A0ABS8D6T4_9NEIS|nr:glycine zipper 2TM domain-containing protein [Leeia speluncae]MCB6183904.1 glycine zipper 2TM domain-containing protein [Leeia speluncae]